MNVTGCTGDLACDGHGECLAVDFAPCTKPAECLSGVCSMTSLLSAGVCRKAIGEACMRGLECATNICDANGRCAACDATTCGGGTCSNGACFRSCTSQASCDNGYSCVSGGLCVHDCPKSPCKNGDVCVNAICVPPTGT